MRSIFASYAEFFQIVGNKNTTIARLRKMMFGATSETSKNVLGDAEDAPNPSPSDASDDASADSESNQDEDSSEPPPGHGRHGADAYPGADQVEVKHPKHAAGDVCPDCGQGTLYEKSPSVLVRFVGQHAGENLSDVLKHRAAELEAPMQMCDGLARNLPKELETILANCLAHGRRNFVELYDRFPDECRHVIESFKVIFHNDKVAREEAMSAEERLVYHQTHSKQTMDDLQAWLQRQFDDKLVEPNSALGDAINYLLKRWEPFTLFLRKAGAPLDNNICERALKKAILHRKNAMFYKTRHGAHVGDMYMSLIYTCELNGANAFDYLNQLQLNAADAAKHPERWMPWNYRESVRSTSDAA
jgi:hypothetical protein